MLKKGGHSKFLMKYKEAIKLSMERLAEDEKTIFLGYNIKYGSQAYGSLIDISNEKIKEMPLAENLMMSMAVGMALGGKLPIVFFERQDFMLIALDAFVNHADKIELLSRGQFKVPLIVRAIVGSSNPIDPGPTHTQDFTEAFKKMGNFPVYEPNTSQEVLDVYSSLKNIQGPVIVVERKELYNNESEVRPKD